MKIYAFYLMDTNIIKYLYDKKLLEGQLDRVDYSEPPPFPYFYAYTDNKKLARTFIKTRTKGIFHEKVLEVDPDSDDMMEFDTGRKIRYGELICGPDSLSIILPITKSEQWVLDNIREYIHDIISQDYITIPMELFTDEFLELLYIVGYGRAELYTSDPQPDDVDFVDDVARGEWKNQLACMWTVFKGMFDEARCLEIGKIGKAT